MSKTYHIGIKGSDWKYNHLSLEWDNGKCDNECYDFPTREKAESCIISHGINNNPNEANGEVIEVEFETDNEQWFREVTTSNLLQWTKTKNDLPPINEDDETDKRSEISIRVLTNSFYGMRFGVYIHKTNRWVISGIDGEPPEQITEWVYINPPS